MPSLVTLVLFDQLVLPMFHFGQVPFKLTYFLIVFWPLADMFLKTKHPANSIGGRSPQRKAVIYFTWLIGASVLGQVTYLGRFSISEGDLYEICRSLLIYLLMLFAFLFGITHQRFNSRELLFVFVPFVALHFVVTYFSDKLPWLKSVYRSEGIVEAGSVQREDVAGQFINPNAAMLMLNMILLGIYLGYRSNRGTRLSIPIYLTVLVASAVVCLQLGSRNQSVVFGIISICSFFEMAKHHASKGLFSILGIVGVLLFIGTWIWMSGFGFVSLENTRFYKRVVERGLSAEEIASRPRLYLDEALTRAMESPVWGSGFVSCGIYPFGHSPMSYHNDWLRVLVSGGLLGVIVMLLIVWRLGMKAGLIMVLPFVLPGLTNTFLLNIPAVIAYFLFAGVFFPSTSRSVSVSLRCT